MVLVVKNSPANVGDLRDPGLIHGLGRSPGRGHGNPLKYYCLGNPHGQGSLAGYMQSTSCEMPGWMKHKLESRLPGEISITSDTQMTPLLWQKVKNSRTS